MKIQKLVLLICGVAAVFSVLYTGIFYIRYQAKLARYEEQAKEIETKENAIYGMKLELAMTTASPVTDLQVEQDEIQSQIDAINESTAEIEEQIASLETAIEEKKTRYEEVKGNADYYASVWKSLREGYEKVRAALSDK